MTSRGATATAYGWAGDSCSLGMCPVFNRWSDFQPLHGATLYEVFLDNRIDVILARIAVPDTLWIDHDSRTLCATVEASGLIDAYLTRASETKSLDSSLGIITHGHRTLIGAARFAAFALVDAEKYMVAVMGFGHGFGHRSVKESDWR